MFILFALVCFATYYGLPAMRAEKIMRCGLRELMKEHEQ